MTKCDHCGNKIDHPYDPFSISFDRIDWCGRCMWEDHNLLSNAKLIGVPSIRVSHPIRWLLPENIAKVKAIPKRKSRKQMIKEAKEDRVICSSCSHHNKPTDNNCWTCGTKLICRTCGR